MYNRILIPVDGSPPSTAALAEALGFARERNARALLVYACEPMPYTLAEGVLDLSAEMRRQGRLILDAAAAAADKAGVTAEMSLVEASDRRIPEVIVDEAKRWNADLIAMGTHGRRGFEHLLLGSVAEGVIRRASVPVLLLRSR